MNQTTSRATDALERFQTFEGMLGRLDAGVMTAILEWQAAVPIAGNIVEFGTYKGRSASLLAHYVRPEENLFLVDVASYLDLDAISKITTNYKFLKIDSKNFVKTAFDDRPQQDFRFIHSDGSHTFNNVYGDLQTGEALLAPSGIMVIDDYFNPHYPQVPAAVFNYLAREKTTLTMALVGSNKCYLCRQGFHATMKKFIRLEFPAIMESFGIPVRLSKTDRNEKMDCFSFTGRPAGSDEKIYGAHLYGHFFKD
jgi:predicted O-methyltransferase YrrM